MSVLFKSLSCNELITALYFASENNDTDSWLLHKNNSEFRFQHINEVKGMHILSICERKDNCWKNTPLQKFPGNRGKESQLVTYGDTMSQI